MTDTPKLATHAAESGHWYTRDCLQVQTVPSKSGTPRKPTLADARRHDWAPGVTSILRCADKPALTNWLIDQAVLAALTLPRREGESEADWLRRVHEDRKEQARKAAEEGTRIHAAIQASVQGDQFDPAYLEHVAGIRSALPTVGAQWVAERTVCHRDGYGTKADLHCWDGRTLYVLDFKGKDGDQAKLDAERTYDEHAMQLAATVEAILYTDEAAGYGPGPGEVNVQAGIVFVSRTDPGVCSVRWVGEPDLFRGWEMFSALLKFWQAKSNHRPWRTLEGVEF